ncbi:hypothetical protein ACTXT7_005244 [Hymenolepis weldensis]
MLQSLFAKIETKMSPQVPNSSEITVSPNLETLETQHNNLPYHYSGHFSRSRKRLKADLLLKSDYTTAKVENDESQWIENDATAKTASATNLRGSDY